MPDETPELSSLSTILDDLVDRLVASATRLQAEGREGIAGELFEVERSLLAAKRRLDSTLRSPDGRSSPRSERGTS